MIEQDIFLRAHTVSATKPRREPPHFIKWPHGILVFDTETSINTSQNLVFGAYRLCELVDESYVCSEEGLFYADDLDARQRKHVEAYAKGNLAEIEFKSFPPKLDLKVFPRWKFVEKVFWKAVKDHRLIAGFNLPFDLSQLAVGWGEAGKGGWSLILSERRSRKTGRLEPNPHRPRITISSPFISTTRPANPEEWPPARFLDVPTLAFALFGESESLEDLCARLKISGKVEHEPSGNISDEEIQYCRADVLATTRALNELKREFDQHPTALRPDLAYSPASLAKSYLDSMGIVPPREKFHSSDQIMGIAMQAYSVAERNVVSGVFLFRWCIRTSPANTRR